MELTQEHDYPEAASSRLISNTRNLTRETALDAGSRSDQPRYRAGRPHALDSGPKRPWWVRRQTHAHLPSQEHCRCRLNAVIISHPAGDRRLSWPEYVPQRRQHEAS